MIIKKNSKRKKKDQKLTSLIHILAYDYIDLKLYDDTVFLVAINNISNNNDNNNNNNNNNKTIIII